ncbi:MAG: acyl carrier protein [Alteromonadaceae bacterium]|jgi:acyl carrier protein
MEQLFKVISDTLGISTNELDIDSSSDNIELWDSLKHMNLIFAIEDEFNITIPDDNLSDSTNVISLMKIISEQQK